METRRRPRQKNDGGKSRRIRKSRFLPPIFGFYIEWGRAGRSRKKREKNERRQGGKTMGGGKES
ncbi:hypothetical protein ACRALDRAFT_2037560 [Sodiomyces alcalophilus JCM 7366]|uniref:uncharacterized protein n=1 Tax=Sodiomyces alcalophilus JCM 7366 TaxID=591952 RepID=UPI0039B3AD3A